MKFIHIRMKKIRKKNYLFKIDNKDSYINIIYNVII